MSTRRECVVTAGCGAAIVGALAASIALITICGCAPKHGANCLVVEEGGREGIIDAAQAVVIEIRRKIRGRGIRVLKISAVLCQEVCSSTYTCNRKSMWCWY